MKRLCLALLTIAITATAARSATIVWSATNGERNYLVDVLGTQFIPDGSLVRLGWFDPGYTDDNIRSDAFTLAGRMNLEQNFNELDFTRTPATVLGTPRPGSFADSVDVLDPTLAGKQLVMLAYVSGDNSSHAQSLATVLQMGAFYMDGEADPSWRIPSDVPVPGQTTIDIGNLNGNQAGAKTADLAPGARIPLGEYTAGDELNSAGSRSFALAAVPEPSTALLACGAGAVLLLRRRTSR